MVLKNDDHAGDFCQEIDASKDSSYNVLPSEWRRDQKGLEQDNDDNAANRRANEAKEVFCSDTNKNDRSGPFEVCLVNRLGQGVEAVDLGIIPGGPILDYDMEDRQLESGKHSQFSEGTIHRSSVSPRDNCHGQSKKAMQSNEVTESDEKCGPSLQSSLGDDVDESDVEEDVKVCDICGDAGREDLLAVCSRCSDGAEHTYCMREMLDKVPEGDWICEECKFNEEVEARRQEHFKLLGGIERSKSLGRTSSVNLDLPYKLDKKDFVGELSRSKNGSINKQLPSKRSGDIIEAGTTAKKQVLETSTGSPTASSPNRVPLLSRESSFKNLEKAKGKQINQFSTDAESAGEFSESARSPPKNLPYNLKGAPCSGHFVKSHSFGSSNLKANVKVSDEVVQKQRQGVDANDGPGKLIGKSMSFKGVARSSVSEPKVKMLSAKCAPVQEAKGQKQVRERSSFERKSTIKSDNSIPVQISANSTKRPPRVDNISTLPASNIRDYKNSQSDGKSTSLPKQALVNKSSDAMASLGEAKRQLSTNSRGSGTSSSAEAKPNYISSKDGPILNSPRAADGLFVPNGVKADVHDNQSDKSLENTYVRFRQGVNGALVSGNRRVLSSDASIPRVQEGMREENKLKAAIEAAMQKKQHIFKKNKISEKPNELSASITQGSHAGDAVSNQALDPIPEEAAHVRDAISKPSKHTSIGSAKQFKVFPADLVVSSEDDSVPSISAIPDQEAVWHGGFEIHRNGKLPDVCGGFQAHLSSFASGKVLEVVKKLPSKIVLNEVSRPVAWPFQFKELGAQEDNIALYFFAKDLDSYLRSYKILLEYMMKHDLAFRGNINGFELLVFPSNHLAHKSQRWNTLFFMWGVFRGRRASFPDDKCASLERPELSVSISNTVPRSKDVASTATEDLSVSDSDTVVSRCVAPVFEGPSLQNSGSLSNGDCYDKGCNVGRTCLSSPTSQGNLEKSTENFSPVLGAEACSEPGIATPEDHSQLDSNIAIHHQQSTAEVGIDNNVHELNKSLPDPMLDKGDTSPHSSEVLRVKEKGCSTVISKQQVICTVNDKIGGSSENSLKQYQCVDNTQKNGGLVKHEIKVEEKEGKKDSMGKKDGDKLKWEGSLKREGYVDINISADDSLEDLHSLKVSPKRPSAEDSNEPKPEAASVIPCQKRPWVDSKDSSKDVDQSYTGKRMKGVDSLFECDLSRLPSSFGDRFAAQMHDVSTSSRVEDTSTEAVDEKLTSVNPESAERCFFLVDSHADQNVLSEDHTSPWKASLLGNEDRLPDGSPNLELALGVEKKQSRTGVLPFFAGKVDRKGPDRAPDIASSKEVDEEATASLSLSLAFPFSDQENSARQDRPLANLEQALPAKREVNTPLLLFRGSSGK